MAPVKDICTKCFIEILEGKEVCYEKHHFDEYDREIPFPPYDICDKAAEKIGKALKIVGRGIKWLFQF